MLIESGNEARVLVPFTEDKGLLRQVLQAAQSLDVAGRLPEAFRLAQANLQQGGRTAVVHVFTDGAFETPTLPDLGGAAIRWHLFGQHGRNIGITAFEVRKTFFGAIDYQAFLSVGNYSSQQATFDLVLTLDVRQGAVPSQQPEHARVRLRADGQLAARELGDLLRVGYGLWLLVAHGDASD